MGFGMFGFGQGYFGGGPMTIVAPIHVPIEICFEHVALESPSLSGVAFRGPSLEDVTLVSPSVTGTTMGTGCDE